MLTYVINLKSYVMKRKLLLLLIISLGALFAQPKAYSQTLSPGDIAFIGYNTSPTDGFSFITLKLIPKDTEIFFTERGWGNGTWVAGSTEPHLKWKVPVDTPAGSIISVIETATADTFTVTGTTGLAMVVGFTGFNLSGGDQMLAYQSPTGLAEPASPVFIAGVNGDYNSGDYDAVTHWNLTTTSGGNSSALPAGLDNGVNCVSLFPGTGEIANNKYNGTLSGQVSVILAAINNYTNWIHDPTTNYTITAAGYPAPALILSVAPTVTTVAATNVKSVSATLGGQVTADGGDASIERGVVWATTVNPTTSNNKVVIAGTLGNFSQTVTGLPAGSLIHFRAYAKNGAGTNYGTDLTFTTGTALSVSSFSQINVKCKGDSTGSASVVIAGGTTPYSYSWSPSGGTGATASNLSAVNYSVTITDGELTQITKNFTIIEPAAILGSSVSSQTNVSCNGGTNGSATIAPSGGASPYFYSWAPSGGTGATASGLTAQTYTVTITDNNSCTTTQTVTISEPTLVQSSPAISAQPTAFSACAGANTSLAVTATNVSTYQWQVDSGSGFVNITNGGTAPLYSGANTATLAINNVTGAMNGFVYRVVLTSSCLKTTTSNNAALTINASPAISSQPSSSTICAGANTTFSITATNATGYQWQVDNGGGFSNISNGAPYSGATTATLTITGTTAGLNGYLYRAIATGGCTPAAVSNNAALTVNSAPSISSHPSASSICAGANTTFSVSATNATGYQWQVDQGLGFSNITNGAPYSGATTATLTIIGATAGLNGYIYRAIATGGCTPNATSNSAALTINSAPTILTQPLSSSICTGTNTTFTISANHATGYQWQVDQGAGFISIANGAPYSGATTATLTITGATVGLNGYRYRAVATGVCVPAVTSDDVLLSVGPAPSITAQPSSATICIGENTTFISAPSNATSVQWQVNEGLGFVNVNNTAPYSGATTPSLTITGATASLNNYQYRLVAVGNCTPNAISSVAILTVPTIVANATQTNVSCNQGGNGTATVAPSGGTAPYTLLWSNNETSSTITGLSAGNYSVTIKDANLCQITQNFTITEPTKLVASQGALINVSCNGGSNGSATVNVTGGAGNYTYSWAPSGGTAATASGLTSGTYTVTVKDANLCQTTQSFTISQPNALSATISKTDILCNGTPSGSASVTVTGGTSNYTYSWSPSGGTSAIASNLSAGDYTVTITDANSCQLTKTVTIIEPPTALIVGVGSITNVACFGGTTGSASVTVSGGTGNYSYSWAPSGGTAATATGLASGTYNVTVTDENGCQKTQSITISQPASALSATTASVGVSCNGGSNGSASVTVTGGTPNYTYAWAPLGGTGSSISGRPAGDYTCTITDANGCSLVKNITINTPAPFSATVSSTDVSCNGGSNGSANITVSGATFPYSYSWSPTGGSAAAASGLSAGDYTVTVTDANNCAYPVSVHISQPTALTMTLSKTDVLCNGGATGTATATPLGGNGSYTYQWSPIGGSNATATGLAAGDYSCTVTDAKGCFVMKTITIIEPNILDATTSQIDATCTTPGQASVTPSGGTLPYSYLWSTGGITNQETNLAAGNHKVEITDGNGCTVTKNFVIVTNNTLVATQSQNDVLCNGANTGSITVIPSGAPGPFSYVWSPSGGNSDTASNLTAGNYSVTITSANGCSIIKNFTITEPSAITLVPSQVNILCNGQATGEATISATGGTGAYTYSWAPSGTTGATATGLAAGTHTVTVKDANGCTAIHNFTIIEPNPIIATVSKTDVTCIGSNNGSVSLSVTGGTGTYTYSWAPLSGTGSTISGLSAGTYAVTITDASSCSITENITISQPDNLVSLSTLTPTSVTVSGAVLTGTVSSDGINRDKGECLAEAGFVFATHANPTVTDTKITIGTALGSLSSSLSNLKGNTTYYVKTYAINSNGNVNYGNEISFTTEKYKLTITATAGHKKVYGTADPVFDYTASGFVNGDTNAIISGNLSRVAGENVGTYAITAGSISAGANYTIVLESATFEITKADQVITWSQSLEFGCDTGEEVQLTASSNSGLPISYTIANSNIGEISGTTLHIKSAGSSTITASQNGNLNYNPATAVTKPVTVSQSGLVIQQWSDVLLFNNQGKIFVAWQWYKNGTAVVGATRQYYSEGQPLNGTYYVIAKDKNGNSIKSCPIVLTGVVFTNTLKVYPNPVKASNEFTLECNFSESQLSGATVTIFNITGTLVQTISNVKAKNQITAPSQSGVYIIMLTLSSGQLKTINLLVN
jgi:predicted secreted protein